jgi:hypothetical protein
MMCPWVIPFTWTIPSFFVGPSSVVLERSPFEVLNEATALEVVTCSPYVSQGKKKEERERERERRTSYEPQKVVGSLSEISPFDVVNSTCIPVSTDRASTTTEIGAFEVVATNSSRSHLGRTSFVSSGIQVNSWIFTLMGALLVCKRVSSALILAWIIAFDVVILTWLPSKSPVIPPLLAVAHKSHLPKWFPPIVPLLVERLRMFAWNDPEMESFVVRALAVFKTLYVPDTLPLVVAISRDLTS